MPARRFRSIDSCQNLLQPKFRNRRNLLGKEAASEEAPGHPEGEETLEEEILAGLEAAAISEALPEEEEEISPEEEAEEAAINLIQLASLFCHQ